MGLGVRIGRGWGSLDDYLPHRNRSQGHRSSNSSCSNGEMTDRHTRTHTHVHTRAHTRTQRERDTHTSTHVPGTARRSCAYDRQTHTDPPPQHTHREDKNTCLKQLEGVVQVDADSVGVEVGEDVHEDGVPDLLQHHLWGEGGGGVVRCGDLGGGMDGGQRARTSRSRLSRISPVKRARK